MPIVHHWDMSQAYRSKTATIIAAAVNVSWSATAPGALPRAARNCIIRNLGAGSITIRINSALADAIVLSAGGVFETVDIVRSVVSLFFSNANAFGVSINVIEIPAAQEYP